MAYFVIVFGFFIINCLPRWTMINNYCDVNGNTKLHDRYCLKAFLFLFFLPNNTSYKLIDFEHATEAILNFCTVIYLILAQYFLDKIFRN
jgi:hypothetical protein